MAIIQELQNLAGNDFLILENALSEWELFKSVYHSFDRIRDYTYNLPKSEQKTYLDNIKEYLNKIPFIECQNVYSRIKDVIKHNFKPFLAEINNYRREMDSFIDELNYFEERFNLLNNSIIDVSIDEEKPDPAPESKIKKKEMVFIDAFNDPERITKDLEELKIDDILLFDNIADVNTGKEKPIFRQDKYNCYAAALCNYWHNNSLYKKKSGTPPWSWMAKHFNAFYSNDEVKALNDSKLSKAARKENFKDFYSEIEEMLD